MHDMRRPLSIRCLAAPVALTAAALMAAVSLVACSSASDQRSEGHYCEQVRTYLPELNTPVIATTVDVQHMLTVYRSIADSAPLAVQQEWETMVAGVETAATVNPTDKVSVQKVADTARSSEPAANRVIDYTYKKCKALIGKVTPVSTTVPLAPTTSARKK
jgi:hypothetical protein